MDFGLISAHEHAPVLRLLAQCGLPTADLNAALLSTFVGARGKDTLAGVVGIEAHGRAGLLRSLAVAPGQRGLGIGSRLCDEAQALARRLGIEHLYLLTTAAADWFAAHGYAPVERAALPEAIRDTEQFRALCPHTAVAMHKPVAAAAR